MSRVEIRRPVAADGPAVLRANRDSQSHHHPWVQAFADEAGFEAWLARANSEEHAGFLAHEAATGDVVGVVNVNNIIRGQFHSAFLGFYGTAAKAGAGLMTEAVGLVVRTAFDDLGLHRLEANIQPGNDRSKALVKRLGFQLEGFSPRYLRIDGDWRDHERWAILADTAPSRS